MKKFDLINRPVGISIVKSLSGVFDLENVNYEDQRRKISIDFVGQMLGYNHIPINIGKRSKQSNLVDTVVDTVFNKDRVYNIVEHSDRQTTVLVGNFLKLKLSPSGDYQSLKILNRNYEINLKFLLI